jgi:hypothetical protein
LSEEFKQLLEGNTSVCFVFHDVDMLPVSTSAPTLQHLDHFERFFCQLFISYMSQFYNDFALSQSNVGFPALDLSVPQFANEFLFVN